MGTRWPLRLVAVLRSGSGAFPFLASMVLWFVFGMADDNDHMFLDPGITRTVIALNHAGHVTCDSGDGENAEYEGEPPFVSIVSTPDYLTTEAKEVLNFLEYNGIRVSDSDNDDGVKVQASYYPKDDIAIIDVIGVHDSMFPEVIRYTRAVTDELQ